MCGLAGIFHPAGGGAVDAALLARMTAAIAHRGPDGDGFHCEPGVGLGHRRLAIIDPAGGQQPMYNEDRSVVIVFNGEIYNFQELRPKLQALGHTFRNRCDTEAIIHAWESFGPDCLKHLSGMFAFALWDRNRRTLFLARDRMGKKPLYYATDAEGRFVFASELAALATVPSLARTLDPAAIDDFFALGYIPDPGSIWRAVKKLPPAHFLLLRAGESVPQPRRYWQVPVQPLAIGEQDAAAQLAEKLSAATAARLVSDVPLGAFLSGGVDSSAVVAMAAQARTTPLDTFTIGFDGEADETPYAEAVAARYGTRQHNARAAAVDVIDAARSVGRVFGEPFGDPSAVPTLTVTALARRQATVALSGDGGDEVFAGYRRYRWHLLVETARRRLPAGVRRHAIGTLARLYPKLDRAPRFLRAKHTLSELSLESALGFAATVTKLQRARRRALYAPSLAAALDGHDPTDRFAALMAECPSTDPLAQAQYVDLATWLAGQMLVKVDRASMANSLEVRSPFLDHDLVAWGLSLPAAAKLARGEGKRVLKRALEPYLPRALLHRPKQGFATSHAATFRAEMPRLRGRLLGEGMLDCGLFAPAALTRMLDEHASGAFDHSQPLWLLLVFEGFLAAQGIAQGGGAHGAAAEAPALLLTS
jgi:asparagine synthase (glutamine-hydrolysing)